MTTTKLLSIDKIQIDPAIQPRVKGLDKAHVTELAEAYADESRRGAIPPPVVWNIKGKGELKLSQGFHRLAAAQQAGLTQIECEVRIGGEVDCAIDALTSNKSHGLKRSNEDKRRAVDRLLELMPKDTSDGHIAELAGVHQTFVGERRRSCLTAPDDEHKPRTVKGKDGKTYTVKPKKPKPDKQVAAESDAPKPPETPAGPSDDKPSDEPVAASVGTAPLAPAAPPEPPAQPPKLPEPDDAEEVPELKKLVAMLKKYIKKNREAVQEITATLGTVIDYANDLQEELKPGETQYLYTRIEHFNNPHPVGPKKVKSQSGRGSTILDAFGIPVQSQFADEFCEPGYLHVAVHLQQAISALSAAGSAYDKFNARGLGQPRFNVADWDKHFQKAEQLILDGYMEWTTNAMPWCVCRKCNGEGAKCAVCKWTGIWGRDTAKYYPQLTKQNNAGAK